MRVVKNIVQRRSDDLMTKREFGNSPGHFFLQTGQPLQSFPAAFSFLISIPVFWNVFFTYPLRQQGNGRRFISERNFFIRMRNEVPPVSFCRFTRIGKYLSDTCQIAGCSRFDPSLRRLSHGVRDRDADWNLHGRQWNQCGQSLTDESGSEGRNKTECGCLRYFRFICPADPDNHVNFIGNQSHSSNSGRNHNHSRPGCRPSAKVLRRTVLLDHFIVIIHCNLSIFFMMQDFRPCLWWRLQPRKMLSSIELMIIDIQAQSIGFLRYC